MFYPATYKFLNQLVHWYTAPSETTNALIDVTGSNGVRLEFKPGEIYFHRFRPDPPDRCADVPGQPETIIFVKASCCEGLPYIYSKYQIKTNGRWVVKSQDINILIPGSLSYSPYGTTTRSHQKCCEAPWGSSTFAVVDWEDMTEELYEYYTLNGGIVIGTPCLFHEFIMWEGFVSSCLDNIISCKHPLQEECQEPGYFISLGDDFDVVIPWIKVVLPLKYETILDAAILFGDLFLTMLGLDPNVVNFLDAVYLISPLILVFNLSLRVSSDEQCVEDDYLRQAKLFVRFCPCPQGYTYVNGQCQPICPEGSHWDPNLEQCVICPPCSIWNGQECVSLSDCLDNEPLPPDNDHYFDPVDKDIKPKPDPGPCPDGWYWDSDECKPKPLPPDPLVCPEDTHYDPVSGTCVPDPTPQCPSGHYWDGSNCVPDPTPKCPDGTFWDGTTCRPDCPNGTYWNGSSCVDPTPIQCPPECYWDGSKCVCGDDNPYPDNNPPDNIPVPRVDERPTLPDPLPVDNPPPGYVKPIWPGQYLCASGEYQIAGPGPSFLPAGTLPNEFPDNGFYTIMYNKAKYSGPLLTTAPGEYYQGYPYGKEVLTGSGDAAFYKIAAPDGTPIWPPQGPSNFALYRGGPTNFNRRVMNVGSYPQLKVAPENRPYFALCYNQPPVELGIWQIEAWFSLQVSGVGCIPNPIIEWFINKFLTTFNGFEGMQHQWLYRTTVFGPAERGSPAPYVDMTSAPDGQPSFRWQNEWVKIDTTAIYIPCLDYTISLMQENTTWRPYN